MTLRGVKIIKDKQGRGKTAIIDLRIHGEELEDFIDKLYIEATKDESITPFDEVVKRLDKKHGIIHLKK